MNLLRDLWNDESGAILSAEMVTVGTVAVLGTTVGLGTLGSAVNEELLDVAKGIRSLDQSYSIQGFTGRRGWTAGSSYIQRPVSESLAELGVGPRTPEAAAKDKAKGEKATTVSPSDDYILPPAVAPAAPTEPVTVTPAEKKLTPGTKTKKN
jgi:hypothetical protein